VHLPPKPEMPKVELPPKPELPTIPEFHFPEPQAKPWVPHYQDCYLEFFARPCTCCHAVLFMCLFSRGFQPILWECAYILGIYNDCLVLTAIFSRKNTLKICMLASVYSFHHNLHLYGSFFLWTKHRSYILFLWLTDVLALTCDIYSLKQCSWVWRSMVLNS
jgi:hypothetical protein